MDYSKSEIIKIVSESIDAIYLTDVENDTYKTIQDNEFFHSFFGDEGAFHIMMSCFFTGRISKEMTKEDTYHAHFENPIGYRNKLANQFRVRVNGKEYTMGMVNYPLDDCKSVLIVNILSVGDYLQSEKADDKASAVNSSYLFSMNVDLLTDSCSNMYMSEVEQNVVGDMEISYIDWRKSIIPMIAEDSQKIFLEYTDPEFLKENLKYHQTKSVDCQMANLVGEIIWVRLIFNRVNTGNDSDFRFVFMIEDIHESRNQLAEKIKNYESLATKDSLTGLMNHGTIDDLLKKYMEEDGNAIVSLIMFDIDHFKKVNDTYGHAVGDYVLKTISTISNQFLVERGCQLGRWGGEEFLGILPGKKVDEVYDIAEELRKKIEEYPFETVNQITSSFGVYQVKPSETAEDAFNEVDMNLYRAKTGGRNCVRKE